MSDKMVWQERYNTCVDFIDSEHKKIFGIINRLLIFTETPGAKSQWACQEGIKYLESYSLKHFQEEEAYMLSINYGRYGAHKQLHDTFRDKTLPKLEHDLESSDYSYEAVRHFLGVCVGWLTGHILSEDLAIVGKGIAKKGNLLPEEEKAALQQTIIRLIHELFVLDTKVVNEHYSGENFGNVLCYRTIYRAEHSEDRHEIIMVFEEKLLVQTCSAMLGLEYTELNDVVVNATRFLAQQFIKGIRSSFPLVDSCNLEAESLLTYDELKTVFKNNKLEYSMLFDTAKGKFAFCFVPNSAHDGLGQIITPDRVMEQINSYLNKNPLKIKRKILVVDDSKVILAAMKKLFESDYEVELCDSSMAAIKRMVTNKPDLILLDYEMPVCDGKQMLEMIRLDEEFAKIPVIFLTGRGDKDSVMKVLELNPAGYMLKTMNTSSIKKNVDYFFKKI